MGKHARGTASEGIRAIASTGARPSHENPAVRSGRSDTRRQAQNLGRQQRRPHKQCLDRLPPAPSPLSHVHVCRSTHVRSATAACGATTCLNAGCIPQSESRWRVGQPRRQSTARASTNQQVSYQVQNTCVCPHPGAPPPSQTPSTLRQSAHTPWIRSVPSHTPWGPRLALSKCPHPVGPLQLPPCSKRSFHCDKQAVFTWLSPRCHSPIAAPPLRPSLAHPDPALHVPFHGRYKTRLCSFGKACRRPICFFAHATDEIRPCALQADEPGEDAECAEYIRQLHAAQDARLLPPEAVQVAVRAGHGWPCVVVLDGTCM
eukprot:357117-Chlamydomonas_euryale.AAC.1